MVGISIAGMGLSVLHINKAITRQMMSCMLMTEVMKSLEPGVDDYPFAPEQSQQQIPARQ